MTAGSGSSEIKIHGDLKMRYNTISYDEFIIQITYIKSFRRYVDTDILIQILYSAVFYFIKKNEKIIPTNILMDPERQRKGAQRNSELLRGFSVTED